MGFTRAAWQRVAGQGAWTLGGQLAVGVTGLLGIRVLTELAPRQVFGEASLLLGILALCRSFFVTPSTNGQTRFHAEFLQRGKARWFTRQISRYAWFGTVVSMTVFFVVFVGWRLRRGDGVRPMLLAALMLTPLIDVPKSVRTIRLNADRLVAPLALWSASESLLTMALCALALRLSPTTGSYVLGQFAGGAVSLALFGYAFFPKLPEDSNEGPAESEPELRRRVVHYGKAFVPLALLSWVLNLGDRYAIEGFLGAREVGLYVAAYSIASRPFIMAKDVVSSVARPILFAAASARHEDRVSKVFRLWILMVAVVLFAGVAGIWLVGPWMARLFLAADYRAQAPQIFVWVGLGYALYGLEQVVEQRILAFEASGALLWPTVIAAAANLALNLVLVPRRGIMGAAQATVVTFALQLVVASVVIVAIARDRGQRV